MIFVPKVLKGVPPPPRSHHTCDQLPDGKRAIIFGGVGPLQKCYNDAYILNTETNEWIPIIPKEKNPPPAPRHSHGSFINSEGNLVIFYGYDGKKQCNDVYVLDIKEQKWTKSQFANSNRGAVPAVKLGASYVVHNKTLYCFGGEIGGRAYNDLHSLNIDKMEWKEESPSGTPPPPRAYHSAAIVGNSMIVFGGEGDGFVKLDDTYVLDLATMSWSRPEFGGEAPDPRSKHGAIGVQNKMIVYAGYTKSFQSDAYLLDMRSGRWRELDIEGTQPKPRRGHTLCMVNSLVVVFGGESAKDLNDVHFIETDLRKSLMPAPSTSNTVLEIAPDGSIIAQQAAAPAEPQKPEMPDLSKLTIEELIGRVQYLWKEREDLEEEKQALKQELEEKEKTIKELQHSLLLQIFADWEKTKNPLFKVLPPPRFEVFENEDFPPLPERVERRSAGRGRAPTAAELLSPNFGKPALMRRPEGEGHE